MNAFRRMKSLALLTCVALGLLPLRSLADDIDIFVGASAGANQNPNVLIVLDNTSNWARQSQQWPGGVQQGQSEVRAIKTAISGLSSNVNVGLLEFVTGGTANDNGGFVRYAVQPMTSANQTTFGGILTTIFNNVTDPTEKRNSNTPYGNLMYDVYNYFAGGNSYSPNGVITSMADGNGYTALPTTFRAPLSSSNSCAHNFIIFIGNPNASGPASDSTANTTTLTNLGGFASELQLPNFTTTNAATAITLGSTSHCYSSANLCTAAGVGTYAPALATTCADTASYPNGCSCGTTVAGTPDCAAGTQRYSVIATQNAGTAMSSGTSVSCYNNAIASPTTTAPAGWPSNKETMTSCPAGQSLWFVGSNLVTANGSCKNKYTYQLQCQLNAPATTNLGYTSACYANQGSCSTGDYAGACNSYTGGCACGNPTTPLGQSCPGGSSLYSVLGNSVTTTVSPTGTYSTDTSTLNADEWSRFLFQHGVAVAGGSNQSIVTYTIDVFNAQQDAQQTSLLMSMAKAGGGKYFAAKNEQSIVAALKQILAEIQSVNSTFASASLPVNATNRTQNANQVFIGMFRPDPDANPRWYGNLKQYQIGSTSTGLDLVDATGATATNLQTGFLVDCALSFWTSDSPTPTAWGNGYYWNGIVDNPVPSSKCTTGVNGTNYNSFSDKPDGAFVEKGAIAEVLRKGNNPPYADNDSTTPTWHVNRTLYTLANGGLAILNASSMPALSANALNFTQGKDVNNDTGQGGPATTTTRPSIHGDVVHSRPLPINYGTAGSPNAGVTVYYGSNDGWLRAVDSSNGKELWAFLAPESASAIASRNPSSATDPLTRLLNNSPMVNYPNVDPSLNPVPKDYFFDGSIGVYQNLDNTKVWIYPTMRRGGRMIYAFDVTTNTSPAYKWRRGCTSLTTDTGCDGGFAGIGQTWSTPNLGFVKGFAPTTPVVFVGGGYDTCEDANSASPSCGSAKGAAVYMINGDSGSLIAAFPTMRSVVADVALVDVDNDGYVDYAYAADTGGNIYRIDLVQYQSTNGVVSYAARGSGNWSIRRVAHTNGGGRKFLFAPALFPLSSGKVIVGIGSGDREHPLASQYPSTGPVLNRFYAYLDALDATTSDINMDDTSIFDDFTTYSSDFSAALSTNCNANNFGNGKKGWFIDLNQFGAGEQTVTSAVISGGLVYFSTNRPIPPAAGTCSTVLGEARGYAINIFNAAGAIGSGNLCGGARSSIFVGGGLPPSPVVGTVPINGVPTTVIIGGIQLGGGASSAIGAQQATPPISARRTVIYRYIKGMDNN